MSTRIAEQHINSMRMEYRCTIWFCKILVVILIGFGLYFAYIAIERQDWLKLVYEAFIVPVTIIVLKFHSWETKNYVDFASKVNDTQIIANDQPTMAKLIRLLKIGRR